MLAHWHGQIWSSSEFGRSFGVADTTVRRYLDVMSGALVVRQLQPWHANLSKRQVKSPKVYVRDSGLLHALLGIENRTDLELQEVVVIHAGEECFPLAKRVRAVAAGRILDDL
jgi:predicted AAA+ superfamily ATPase